MKELKERFEIPDMVRIESGHGGLTKIVVNTPQAAAEIYLHGAQVTHFHPADQLPVIWMSQKSLYQPGKAIRGGVPICFPWFGPRQDDPKAPVHGFARVRDWNLDSVTRSGDGAIVVTLSLKSDEATRAIWPADFVARHTITISSTLQMQLDVQNASAQPIRFEEALHTYFIIGDIRQTTVEGLGGTTYIDKVGTNADEAAV